MKSRNIAIDVSALDPQFKEHSTRGIGRYAREMKKYFDCFVSEDVSVGNFDHKQLLSNSLLASLIDYSPIGKQTLKQQLLYPLKLNSRDLDKYSCLHFLAQTDAPTWSPKKYIITVHDLIPLKLPELYKANNPGWRYSLARYFELQAIRNASGIITISENTKKDLMELLGIAEEKIFVTHLGVDYDYFSAALEFDFDEVKAKYGVSASEFVLYVGGIDPRKNYKGLVESFALMLSDMKSAGHQKLPQLLMAGKINQDKEFPALLELITEHKLSEYVVFAGFVPDEDLVKLYKSCAVFCFLSLYEGFGLTPLEALAAGAPVVSSCTSAMPEVLGQAALLVNPESPRDCAEAMFSLVTDKIKRDELRRIGPAQAIKYTWEKCGDNTLKAYRYFDIAAV
jgi:glycosyltransferase involved in cell wall biosynthesis